jgi:hypothetical protein
VLGLRVCYIPTIERGVVVAGRALYHSAKDKWLDKIVGTIDENDRDIARLSGADRVPKQSLSVWRNPD